MGLGKKPEGQKRGSRKERTFRGEFITFLVLFFLLWLLSYILTRLFPDFTVAAQNHVAREIAWCLDRLGYHYTLKDSTLTFLTSHGGERLVVIAECTGLYTSIIYFSIIGAYPATVLEKIWGLLIGLPLIHVLNLIRMVFIALILYHKPQLFDLVHGYLWQIGFVIFMLLLVIFWMSRIVRPRARAAEASSPSSGKEG